MKVQVAKITEALATELKGQKIPNSDSFYNPVFIDGNWCVSLKEAKDLEHIIIEINIENEPE